MVQTSVDRRDVARAPGVRKTPAVGNHDPTPIRVPRGEGQRKIDPDPTGEAEPLECSQAIASSAEKFDDFRVPRPPPGAQSREAAKEFPGFLFGSLEPEVRRFPGVRCGVFPLRDAFGTARKERFQIGFSFVGIDAAGESCATKWRDFPKNQSRTGG